TPVILSVPDEAPVTKISVSAAKLQLRSLRNAEKKIREVDAQLAGHGLARRVELAGHQPGEIELAARDGIGLGIVLHAAQFPADCDCVFGQNVCDAIVET